MKRQLKYLNLAFAVVAAACACAPTAQAASLNFVGSDSDIGGTFFPGGAPPYTVVPWRSETATKLYDADGNNVYGSEGYAAFATQFAYPTYPGCCGSSVSFGSATYPNKIDLPSFVSASQNLTSNKVGGWSYALIDDPDLVNGYRDYNWGTTLSPPRPGPDQSPYVKLGILDGGDIFGNNPKTAANGSGRWAFTVGADVPHRFRVGVMTDGLDSTVWAATEVLLHQVSGTSIVNTAMTGTLVRNRFVDIHSFDIIGAQPGDSFAIFARAPAVGDGNGAISAVTFDLYVPEPASAALALVAMFGLACVRRRSA